MKKIGFYTCVAIVILFIPIHLPYTWYMNKEYFRDEEVSFIEMAKWYLIGVIWVIKIGDELLND